MQERQPVRNLLRAPDPLIRAGALFPDVLYRALDIHACVVNARRHVANEVVRPFSWLLVRWERQGERRYLRLVGRTALDFAGVVFGDEVSQVAAGFLEA